ncbi:MAG: hypothetical protein JKP98_24080 [Rhodobacteraceae bacterium]|nr:hypothetical protein [Paracoccaceae bacterium]
MLDDLREKGRGLDLLVRAGFVFQRLYSWTAEAPSGPAEAAFGAMRHVHGAAFRALPFLPVALAPTGRWALPSGTVPDRLATWLRAQTRWRWRRACSTPGRTAPRGSARGRAGRSRPRRQRSPNTRSSRCRCCAPRYGLSARGARQALKRLTAADLSREITGRGRFRLYRIAQGKVPGV